MCNRKMQKRHCRRAARNAFFNNYKTKSERQVAELGKLQLFVVLLGPFLVIGIYRLIAGFQIPIWLGVTFVLGSIIMGSVLITTTDILSASNVGFLSALKGGILAHVDNTRYFVATVWLKIGLSILIASVPTMLLLAWGKRKTKVL